MFTQNKFLKVSLSIIFAVAFVSVIVFLVSIKKPQLEDGSNQNQGDGEDIVLKSKIVEEQVIASNGDGFPRFSFKKGNEEFILATYPYTIILGTDIEEGTGFMVFRYDNDGIIKKIWKEKFFTSRTTTFSKEDGLRDLNGDGVKELLIYVWAPRGNVGNLWIYQWKENNFNILNPIEDKDSKPTRVDFEVSSYSNLEFVDIEKDGKIEISLLFPKGVRLGPGVDDFRIDIYKRIYKWDGGKEPYYLWKEEKIEE